MNLLSLLLLASCASLVKPNILDKLGLADIADALFTGGFGAYGGQAGGSPGCSILKGTNIHRARKRLARLRANKRLDASAMMICQDMANQNLLDHHAGGTTPGIRVKRAGYKWNRVAENIYDEIGFGLPNPLRAIKGWIESPGHEANIVGDYTDMGSAYCFGRGGKVFWAQNFGRGDEDPSDIYSCSDDDAIFDAPPPPRARQRRPVEPVAPLPAPMPVNNAYGGLLTPLPAAPVPSNNAYGGLLEPVVSAPVVGSYGGPLEPVAPVAHTVGRFDGPLRAPCIVTAYGPKHYKRDLQPDAGKRRSRSKRVEEAGWRDKAVSARATLVAVVAGAEDT